MGFDAIPPFTLMNESPAILIVEDDPLFGAMLVELLESEAYAVEWIQDSRLAEERAATGRYEAVLLDVGMPELNGFQVCRLLKGNPRTSHLPVFIVTAWSDTPHIVEGFASGADDYIGKPVHAPELFARLRTHLRLKKLRDDLASANAQILAANERLVLINEWLDRTVVQKVEELNRATRLRYYFSPKMATAILSGESGDPLAGHRREITVVFFDLRGFTAFVEKHDPAMVLSLLREFHGAVGPVIFEEEGIIEHFSGDGFMAFFGDPEPVNDHAWRAVQSALKVRSIFGGLSIQWDLRGIHLGLGVGIASGEAILGNIGFAERLDYAAIGVVTNTAARLCDLAKNGEILLNPETAEGVRRRVPVKPYGAVSLKGFSQPLPVFQPVE